MRRAAAMLVLLLLLPLGGVAAPEEEATGRSLLGFADHLFQQKDYYRAITEYERFLFLFPQDRRGRYARYQIARSYFEGDKLPTAIARLRELTTESVADEPGRDALLLLGEAYERRQDYDRARETYEDFLRKAPDARLDDAVRIRIGWCALKSGNWRQAADDFRNLPPSSPLKEQADGLAAGAAAFPDIPSKSPTLAGSMSAILPGAGQLYVGRYGDATISFLLNGTFIWATAEQFRKDNHVTGGILLFFETGWYLGNIYNAVGSAHKYNRRAKQSYLDRLQDRYRVSYSQDRDGMHVLAFTVRF